MFSGKSDGKFIKTGGTIYGYDAGDPKNSNVIKNSSNDKGHAVYVQGTTYRKETTVGPGDKLSFNGP
jgi:hypothetical protein